MEEHETDPDSERLWNRIEALKRVGGPDTNARNDVRGHRSGRALRRVPPGRDETERTVEVEELSYLAGALYKIMQAEATSGQSSARARLEAEIQASLAVVESRDRSLPLHEPTEYASTAARLRPNRIASGRRTATPDDFSRRNLWRRYAVIGSVLLILALAVVAGLRAHFHTQDRLTDASSHLQR